MLIKKIEEAGYNSAMFGLSLNKNQPINKMHEVALKLSGMDLGHNKFLESIQTWWSVTAPRYWWQDADTYRISSKQSESTNHTILSHSLTTNNFEYGDITESYLAELNYLIEIKDFLKLKRKLPEGFLQMREWHMSYKTLRNIIKQRYNHILPYWKNFCEEVFQQVDHPEFLPKL